MAAISEHLEIAAKVRLARDGKHNPAEFDGILSAAANSIEALARVAPVERSPAIESLYSAREQAHRAELVAAADLTKARAVVSALDMAIAGAENAEARAEQQRERAAKGGK